MSEYHHREEIDEFEQNRQIRPISPSPAKRRASKASRKLGGKGARKLAEKTVVKVAAEKLSELDRTHPPPGPAKPRVVKSAKVHGGKKSAAKRGKGPAFGPPPRG